MVYLKLLHLQIKYCSHMTWTFKNNKMFNNTDSQITDDLDGNNNDDDDDYDDDYNDDNCGDNVIM